MSNTDDVLIERIQRLEKKTQRLRLWLLLMTLVAILMMAWSPAIVVRNPFNGARVGMTAYSGTSVLALWNSEGENRLQFGATRKGGAINLLGREGTSRLTFFTTEKEGNDVPVLMMCDDTNPRAAFQVDMYEHGSPHLTMIPPIGKGRIDLKFLPDGDPIFRLIGKDGELMFETPHREESVENPIDPWR